MAKKKQNISAHKSVGKKKNNTLLWGIGVLILLVIIILIVRGCKPAADQTKEPVKVTPTETPADKPVTKLTLGEAVCSVDAAIGFKSCNLLESGDVEFKILHLGSGKLIGFQYYVYDENSLKIGEDAQMLVVEGGAEASLTLPVSKFANAAGVEIRPVMNVDGTDSICKNQHVFQSVNRC